jgi:hypothetical protein
LVLLESAQQVRFKERNFIIFRPEL